MNDAGVRAAVQDPRRVNTPIIAFASGKGGAGKTSLCLNTALLLAQQGRKVLVFDGDYGLANIDVQLGLTPQQDLSDVIEGRCTLEDILTKSDRGFWVLPGRSGAQSTSLINTLQKHDILKQLRNLSGAFDVVLLDVGAGVDDSVLGLTYTADRTVLVVTPDPSSITDAYAVVKLQQARYGNSNCQLLINQAGGQTEGQLTAEKIQKAANNFLQVQLPLLGIIPYDRQYAAAVKQQKLLVQAFPNSESAAALSHVVGQLVPRQAAA